MFGQQDSQRQFPGSFPEFRAPKLLQMTSLRSLPRFAAGQEASHRPANEIANTEDFVFLRTRFLNIIATKKTTKAPTRRTPARERPSHQPPNSFASGSIVCNFVHQVSPAKYSPKICSEKHETFRQQMIFSASLQHPSAGADTANF